MAEEPLVFFPRSVPLELTESRLHALRLSLNTPVVSTQELPVGPARASLVVHQEPDGRPNVTVALRSLRSGAVVLYSFEGDLREESSLDVGIDGALSFAESMGFLFDEDEVAAGAPDGKARALGLWGDLMGQPGVAHVPPGEGSADAPSEPPRRPDPAPAATVEPLVVDEEDPFGDPSELDRQGLPQFEGDPGAALEVQPASRDAFGESTQPGEQGYIPQFDGDTGAPPELLAAEGLAGEVFGQGDTDLREPQESVSGDSDDAPVLDLGAEAVEIGPSGAPEVPLTKFREGPPPAPDAPSPGRTTLARLKLVRREPEDGRPHPIARLFGAF